jgi:hypothetical protein
MTNAQKATFDFIDSKVEGEAITLSWDEILVAIRSQKFRIRNWMAVRNVLQVYLNEGTLVRTSDLTVEVYEIKR